MKAFVTMFLAAGLLLGTLTGCGRVESVSATAPPDPAQASLSTAPTAPADGDPSTVACKGSYTGQGQDTAVVAQVGDQTLTNGLLRAFYWAEVANWRNSRQPMQPDESQPLDVQPCSADSSVGSWQQFFLKRALNTWHTAQALALQSQQVPLPTEEAYQPDLEEHQEIMTNMPATKVLYGYHTIYEPNSMHQAYLDQIPQQLQELAGRQGYDSVQTLAQEMFGTTEQDLEDFARLYNRSYMYFTTLTYNLEPVALPEDIPGQPLVTFRHVLLHPQYPHNPWRQEAVEEPVVAADGTVSGSEELWSAGEKTAKQLLQQVRTGRMKKEAGFADLAHRQSLDLGSGENGGLYRHIAKGQLPQSLEDWLFDPARQPGDDGVIRSPYGFHLMYFVSRTTREALEAQQSQVHQQQLDLLDQARTAYPMTVSYDSIVLTQAQGQLPGQKLLYPDVAHERYPEVPLYLQRDYPDTMYGAYPIRSHGCGITTMAMLASYMTDTELTPPELCRRYGNYSHKNGTDGMMFNYTPAEMGFYLRDKVYNPTEAKAALEQGYPLVVSQNKGFWTRGGHYLLVEQLNEDGTVQVRDSNLLNYQRLEEHAQDAFPWSTIPPQCKGYWIFDKKIRTIPACIRCGDPESCGSSFIPEGYVCEKCSQAMMRRNTYLENS